MLPMVTEFMNYGQQTVRAARYIGQGFMITLSHANRLPVTIQYPYEKLITSERFRGRIHFEFDKCIACEVCVRVCPIDLPVVDWKLETDIRKKRLLNYTAAQLLIYVGAINVLIIFAVMFINGSEYSKDFHLWTVGDGVTYVVCTSLFVSLITTIPDTSWYGIIWTTKANQIIEQDLISNSQQIGIHLSTDFFLPFEFISIILLVALIGAIAVARQ
ncbi:hypothetical protein L6452_45665 [Arctium lappa]|nr:hypothetical protein L6452_45665 [Arctium lappa]